MVKTREPDVLRPIDGLAQFIQGYDGTYLVFLQTFDDLHAVFKRLFSRLVNLILLDDIFQGGLLRLGLLYLGIQIGNLVVQRRVPQVARGSESQNDEDQKDRHEIGG